MWSLQKNVGAEDPLRKGKRGRGRSGMGDITLSTHDLYARMVAFCATGEREGG